MRMKRANTIFIESEQHNSHLGFVFASESQLTKFKYNTSMQHMERQPKLTELTCFWADMYYLRCSELLLEMRIICNNFEMSMESVDGAQIEDTVAI